MSPIITLKFYLISHCINLSFENKYSNNKIAYFLLIRIFFINFADIFLSLLLSSIYFLSSSKAKLGILINIFIEKSESFLILAQYLEKIQNYLIKKSCKSNKIIKKRFHSLL